MPRKSRKASQPTADQLAEALEGHDDQHDDLADAFNQTQQRHNALVELDDIHNSTDVEPFAPHRRLDELAAAQSHDRQNDDGDRGRPSENDEGSGARTITDRELAVLRVVLNPSNGLLTQEERAELAGVSLATYRRIMADPWIRDLRNRLIMEELSAAMPMVVRAALVTAATPGRDGHHDRRMVLSMAGLHSNERTVHVNGEIKHTTAGRLAQALARQEEMTKKAEPIEAEFEPVSQE